MTPQSRILIADDEPTARLLMDRALRQAGFLVTLASDGVDALHQFQADACDIVMLDVDMPHLNGFEVCAALRKQVGNELPIIMVTGMDDLASIERAYESGATDFMSKPINWALLGHRVKYSLRSHQLLRDLNRANARNAAILDALPDTLFRLDNHGKVLSAGVRVLARHDISTPVIDHALDESYPAKVANLICNSMEHARKSGLVQEVGFMLGDEKFPQRHFEARVVAIDEQEALCLVRDITDRKDAEERIHNLAYFDSLTRLPSRLSFIERLNREVQRAATLGSKLGVLFLDLDGFKSINDTLGHTMGDLALREVAERLRQGLRPSDMLSRGNPLDAGVSLARLGGDEFTVLILDLNEPEDAMIIAERVKELLRRPFNLENHEVVMTASIGIAIFPDDGHDGASLLKHADTAMYSAKDEGRDSHKFYRACMTHNAVERMNLDNHLRMALEREEFFLVYQPQYDPARGCIRSVEALLRWNHPTRGLVSPAEFIPRIEANGLIVPIGEWVLRTACTDLMSWQQYSSELRMAVNLSPMQFKNGSLLSTIQMILDETGLPPTKLELEVTEGGLMDCSEANLQTLYALRETGTTIALDDFGTGYSSMSYLKRLPLNHIKVDQSFISGLPGSKDSLAIVKAIISLAKNLDFTVTAEGVETVEQAMLLKSLHCDKLQGFYFSKPDPASAIPALLERRWGIVSITSLQDQAEPGYTPELRSDAPAIRMA